MYTAEIRSEQTYLAEQISGSQNAKFPTQRHVVYGILTLNL